jgi:hypothetical protein
MNSSDLQPSHAARSKAASFNSIARRRIAGSWCDGEQPQVIPEASDSMRRPAESTSARIFAHSAGVDATVKTPVSAMPSSIA